jgi:hypothetical protein
LVGGLLLQMREIEKMTEDANHVSDIGARFVQTITQFAPSFKLYIDYINNYNRAVNIARQEIEKNKKLRNVIQKQSELLQSMNLRNSDLESYMIIPAQRIPRYRLLLTELVKTFPESDENYNRVRKAVEDVSKIADYCNEKRREFENAARMIEIIRELKLEDFIVPNRHFIHEEIATDLHVLRGDKPVRCDLYIFNDVMLITTYELMSLRKQLIALVSIELTRESPQLILSSTDSKLILKCESEQQEEKLFNVLNTIIQKNEKVIAPVTPVTERKKGFSLNPTLIERVLSLDKANFLRRTPRERRRTVFGANENISTNEHEEETPPIKEGYLVKQGHVAKNWKKRYFVLKSDVIIYYENDQKKKEKGTISLKNARMTERVNSPNLFQVYDVVFDKTYSLQASSEDECDEWFTAVNKASQNLAD